MTAVVREVMRTVVPVGLHASYREIVDNLVAQGVGAVPVVNDEGRVVGIVSEGDLLRIRTRHNVRDHGTRHAHWRWAGHRSAPVVPTAQSLMTGPVTMVPATEPVWQALAQIEAAGVRQLPVIDEGLRPIGLITRAQIVREELLRTDQEIQDEIVNGVLLAALCLEPATVVVRVRDGIVTLVGQLESEELLPQLLYLVEQVPGVVGIDSRVSSREAARHGTS